MRQACFPIILFVAGWCAVLSSPLIPSPPEQPQKTTGEANTEYPFRFPEKGNIRPMLSPDGRWIVFQEAGDPTSGWFYTEVGKEEKNPLPLAKKKVPGKVIPGLACWSREGKTLALLARIDDLEQVVLVSFAGSAPRFIASIPDADIGYPVWLESGEFLYLASAPGRIMVASSKGKVRTLTSHVGGPSDRGLFYFQATPRGDVLYLGGDSLALLKFGDSGRIKVTEVYHTPEPLTFSFSPNGRFALLDGGSAHQGQVLLLDLAASQMKESLELGKNLQLEMKDAKVIMTLPQPAQSEWSPDGARLACLEKGPQGRFFILDAASGARKELSDAVDNFAWMPDGRRILFSTSSTADPGLFVMSAEDGTIIGKLSSTAAGDPPGLSADGKVIVWQARGAEAFFVLRQEGQVLNYKNLIFQDLTP